MCGQELNFHFGMFISDLPCTLLRQLLPYLSAYELHRLHSVFESSGKILSKF